MSAVRAVLKGAFRTTLRSSVVLRRTRSFAIASSATRPNMSGVSVNVKSSVDKTARKYSSMEGAAPVIDFPKMKEIAESKDDKYVIVDVREPDEYSAGHIPGAINIPVKSSPGALGLDAEEFKDTFGFEKPDTNKTLVFYCLAGVRAGMGEELASTFGYEHRLNYVGSFGDWMKNKGEVEIPKQA